jgi:17beta-estradiol 17-dehydrogenase / very-long-chain 3-oxoacyl-CoA reductase
VVSVVGEVLCHGLSWLTVRALKALAGDFCAFFLAPLGILRIILKKYGSWAGSHIKISRVSQQIVRYTMTLSLSLSLSPVVTCASEGIGRGYALEVGVMINLHCL